MKLLSKFFLLALCPLFASATVITSGTITLAAPQHTDSFDFSGPGFSVSGQFFGGGGNWWMSSLCPSPCSAGTQVSISGDAIDMDFDALHGTATVDGTNLGAVRWTDPLEAAPTNIFVTGPPITLDAGPGTYHSTFSVSGKMCGTRASDPGVKPCIVNLPNLTGSGVVDATFALDPRGDYLYTGAVYTFTATPEPRTWMLALVGILPILAWRRRMAKREPGGVC